MFSSGITTSISVVTLLLTTLAMKCETNAQTSRGRSVKMPVFRAMSDSVDYHTTMDRLANMYRQDHVDEPQADSLRNVIDQIVRERIVRYRIIYYPTPGFIEMHQLDTITDPTTVESLSLSGGNAQLDPAVFRCPNLKRLELINTSIKKLPGALARLKSLEEVIICNNTINGRLKLEKNERILQLTIHGDDPTNLPRSYRRLKNLQTLDLSENHLKKFPKGIRRNRKLLALDLQENELEWRAFERIPVCRSLERLALQHNRLQAVPASITRFKKLKRLSLNYNNITTVHPRFANLSGLEYVSFYQNRLRQIPTPLYALASLRVLDLFHNEIEGLDTTLHRWKNLEILYLAHNKIVFLPANLNRLTSLTHLYLDHNRIDRLPESVGRLSGLQVLKINHNWIKELPASVLKLHVLEELDISNNYIQDIPPEIFDFKNYKIFSLANNPWSPRTKSFLHQKVKELRARDVFVHVLGQSDTD